MSDFTYAPSQYVPYRGIDPAVIERCRRMTPEELVQHPNPDYKIEILPSLDIRMRTFMDMLKRIITANEEGRNCVLLLPNPWKEYRFVAGFINTMRIDCHRLYCFAMDEYADQDGNIAPADWEWGFVNSKVTSFWANIDEELRPPRDHFIGFTKENLDHYGEMMQELGGVDCGYFGPGWTGHLAFIEPDAPEFQMPLEEWKKAKARICTLSPFTLAQNSLHGVFGQSGYVTSVPPRAATIGPVDVKRAKERIEGHALLTNNTFSSWQRMTSRLVTHGPVTPLVPSSMLQTMKTQGYISEEVAAPFECWEKVGY